jgi:class 3 adenylate cyclase
MMLLHELFSKYDNLCSRYGIYKVETIGDCYMACSGLLVDNPDHARHLVEFGQAMLGVAASVPHPLGGSVHIRVGVHSGRVMSGIVGSIRARYCLFGDTVNTASRMESTGVVDHIQVGRQQYQGSGTLMHVERLQHRPQTAGSLGLMAHGWVAAACRSLRTPTSCWGSCSRTLTYGRQWQSRARA